MIKKAIVTGAGGFIGSALTKKLLEQGTYVIGVDISETMLKKFETYENFKPIIAGFDTYNTLSEKISDRDIDVFFHFALKGSFGESLKDYTLQLYNAEGACKAIQAAINCDCRKFILAGTANQFEVINYLTLEKYEPRYTCIYSAGKIAADVMCKTIAFNEGIEYNCGLIAMAYGEGNFSRVSLPNVVISKLLKNEIPDLIEGNNIYDMIYIDDITEAFIAIAKRGGNLKNYYIGHRKPKLFKENMNMIRDAINTTIQLNFGAYKDVPSGMDYSKIDLNALYNDTGFECKADFRESILKTAEWVKTLNWE